MRYIVYGAGRNCEPVLRFLGCERVECICDKYVTGVEVLGKRIVKMPEMEELYFSGDYIVVISCQDASIVSEVTQEFRERGIVRFFAFDGIRDYHMEEYLPNYSIYRKWQSVSYRDVLANYRIEQYQHIAIVGGNEFLKYLISEIVMQCGSFTVEYLIETESYMGIPSVSLDDVEDKVDCVIINSKQKDTDIITRLSPQKMYDVVDLYDICQFVPQYMHPELKKYKDIHKGERCFIIGNGPSLQYQDLDTLERNKEICFGANKIYRSFENTKWRPAYLCISDPFMNESCGPSIDIEEYEEVFFVDDYHWTMNRRVDGVNYVHFIDIDFGTGFPRFSADICRGVYIGYSVIYDLCLQLAMYMGFSEVYLLGVDHSFTGNVTDNQNHFVKDYFTDNDRKIYDENNLQKAKMDKVTNAFISANKWTQAHGARVYNATRGGNLEVFERRNFDELF